jgi:beta-galactosidase/beta-glucuronidase
VDEANVESHELWEKKAYIADWSEWTGAFVARGVAMVERDKNHPSVVLWSMGNETGLGRNMDAMYAAMKAIDPTRPIHYESRNPPYAPTLSSFDVISTMYPTVEHVLDLMNQDPTRPAIICEYAHGLRRPPAPPRPDRAAVAEARRGAGTCRCQWPAPQASCARYAPASRSLRSQLRWNSPACTACRRTTGCRQG